MPFPLISEYIEAIKSAEDNLDELSYLRPVLGDDGLPVMTSGNFAVVFKMKDERDGKLYALKCFTRDQEGRAEAYQEIVKYLKDVSSSYLVSIRYLEKELFVDTDQTSETEFPVLLMDWVEGKTLDKYLRENLDDKCALEVLAFRFSRLAQWLISQPFAHGDLKPDNILVCEDSTLVLVDYDGIYVPAMKGQKARELGSPNFHHPLRTEDDFNGYIDDFPIVSILLSLKSISLNPSLLGEYAAKDRLLLSKNDYHNICNCSFFKNRFPSINNDENFLFGLLVCLLTSKHMFLYDETLLYFPAPTLPTETDDDNVGEKKDCIRYSKDYKYVLGIYGNPYDLPFLPYNITDIDKRARIICDFAFDTKADSQRSYIVYDDCDRPCVYPSDIDIPKGVLAIGVGAFADSNLFYISLPESLISIGNWAFSQSSIEHLSIPEGVSNIGESVFFGCSELKYVKLPNHIKSIPKQMFYDCTSLETISLPETVKTIGEAAFCGCEKLKSIKLPSSLILIEKSAFENCSFLKSIEIPSSLSFINESTFAGCTSLSNISIPAKLERIGNKAFSGCCSILTLIFPCGVKTIEHFAFEGCKNLCSITLQTNIEKIGLYAFKDCHSLKHIFIPLGTKCYFENLIDKMYRDDSLCRWFLPSSIVDDLKNMLTETTTEKTNNISYP